MRSSSCSLSCLFVCCLSFVFLNVDVVYCYAPFDHAVIPVCVVGQAPFVFYDPTKPGTDSNAPPQSNQFTGYAIDHVQALLPYLGTNVTFSYHISPDQSSGALINPGSATPLYSGCIGDVQNGTAWFAAGGITITQPRLLVVNFTVPWVEQGLEILVLKPPAIRDNWAFKNPFTNELWASFFLMALAVGILSFILDSLSPFGLQPGSSEKHHHSTALNEYLINSCKAIVGMKDAKPQRAWSSRILLFAFFFFFLVMLTVYVAKLVDILSAQVVVPDITSYKDLNNNPNLNWTLVGYGASYDYFTTTTNPSFVNLQNTMIVVPELSDALALLHAGQVAAVIDASGVLEYVVNQPYKTSKTVGKGACDGLSVGEQFLETSYGYPVNPKLPATVTSLMSNAILQVQESGVRDTLYTKWYVDFGTCVNANTVDPVAAIDIVDLAGLWYVMLVFIGVAFAFGLVEHFLHSHKDHESEHVQRLQHFLGKHVPPAHGHGHH